MKGGGARARARCTCQREHFMIMASAARHAAPRRAALRSAACDLQVSKLVSLLRFRREQRAGERSRAEGSRGEHGEAARSAAKQSEAERSGAEQSEAEESEADKAKQTKRSRADQGEAKRAFNIFGEEPPRMKGGGARARTMHLPAGAPHDHGIQDTLASISTPRT